MESLHIPSFNDFSPGLLNNDIRPILDCVAKNSKNDEAIFAAWAKLFPTWDKKRIQTNITATLTSTKLASKRPLVLSEFGLKVLNAESANSGVEIFCTEIIKNQNGRKLIEAIQSLYLRGEKATKVTLQAELALLGVKLSNDTTDHTTLKNWMIVAGLVSERKKS